MPFEAVGSVYTPLLKVWFKSKEGHTIYTNVCFVFQKNSIIKKKKKNH